MGFVGFVCHKNKHGVGGQRSNVQKSCPKSSDRDPPGQVYCCESEDEVPRQAVDLSCHGLRDSNASGGVVFDERCDGLSLAAKHFLGSFGDPATPNIKAGKVAKGREDALLGVRTPAV